MSEYLWDAQSALHEGVWTILVSAPSRSFTTRCSLKSKEWRLLQQGRTLELFQKEIFSLQNTMILSPCNMSWGCWSALVPNVQTLTSRTALADLCFLLWFNVLFIQFLFVFVSSVRSSNSHPDLLVTHPHFFRPHSPQHWTFTIWATTAI